MGVAIGIKPRDQVPVSLEFEYALIKIALAGPLQLRLVYAGIGLGY